MGLSEFIGSYLFWNIIMYLFLISTTALAVYLAKKNKHKIFMVILILYFLISIFMDIPFGNLLNYIYFLFLGVRFIYRKFKPKI